LNVQHKTILCASCTNKNAHNDIFVSIARYKQTVITATQGPRNSVVRLIVQQQQQQNTIIIYKL